MKQTYKAVFARGGTSKGLLFHRDDLPEDRADWDAVFLGAMGSPDPSGRQLNGMGGGVSSLSKVCIVGPPTVPDADIDYTFAQVQIKTALVDYSGNCGNMASAIGPYLVDEGLFPVSGETASVRIHNVNTGKLIRSTFAVSEGSTVEAGSLSIPGVAGTGSPIRLDFLDPGGATTGHLLPTGEVRTVIDVPEFGALEVSMVDVANACVFVRAADLGLLGTELPTELESRIDILEALDHVRRSASVAMGITPDLEAARRSPLVPLVAMVSSAADYVTISGETVSGTDCDLAVRMISNGQPHRAVPMTGGLCTAVAARIQGTVVAEAARAGASASPLRLAMPSGVIELESVVNETDGEIVAESGALYRTSRRLFKGDVYPA